MQRSSAFATLDRYRIGTARAHFFVAMAKDVGQPGAGAGIGIGKSKGCKEWIHCVDEVLHMFAHSCFLDFFHGENEDLPSTFKR